MRTQVTVATLNGVPQTVEVESIFPLSPEWFTRNGLEKA